MSIVSMRKALISYKVPHGDNEATPINSHQTRIIAHGQSLVSKQSQEEERFTIMALNVLRDYEVRGLASLVLSNVMATNSSLMESSDHSGK